MLKRQMWMTDDDEFDHILENSQGVLGLSDQFENHPYVEEFTKERSVMFVYGTYFLEGEADVQFSLGDIWNLFQEDLLPNNVSNFCRLFCRQLYDKLYEGMELPTKNIRSSPEHRDHQTITQDYDGG